MPEGPNLLGIWHWRLVTSTFTVERNLLLDGLSLETSFFINHVVVHLIIVLIRVSVVLVSAVINAFIVAIVAQIVTIVVV